jgi:hypothetical protein
LHNQKQYKVNLIKLNNKQYQCEIDGHRIKFTYFKDDSSNKFFCFVNDNVYEFNVDEPKFLKELTGEGASLANDSLEYYSPMPGKFLTIINTNSKSDFF